MRMPLPPYGRILWLLIELDRKVDTVMTNQDELNARVDKLNAGLDAVEAEIADLKSQPGAENLDFSGLDTAVSRLQADAPAPAPDNPPSA